DIDFENSIRGRAIDIVDIGMPNDQYNLDKIQAWVSGSPVSGIRPSQYVKPGVEVHIEDQAIQPGYGRNFRLEATARNLVFQDTTRKDYASLRITPTWFGEQYVVNTSDILLQVHIPPGVKPDEVLSQNVPFTGVDFQENHVIVTWRTTRRLTGPFLVGVSFPKRVMNKVVTMSFN